jgi:hypothetical protein
LAEPWQVVDVRFDPAAGRIAFQVAFTPEARFACPDCGAEHQPVHDTLQREWRHLLHKDEDGRWPERSSGLPAVPRGGGEAGGHQFRGLMEPLTCLSASALRCSREAPPCSH